MAEKVLILGESGTGKSASMRNFDKSEIVVISCAGKRLPFKNDFETVFPSFERMTVDVLAAMNDAANKGVKALVIDDAQYIMSFQYMRRIKENGWDKWNDIQGDFFNIIQWADNLPADMIVYFLSHVERDGNGREKIKTMGKMLDEKITIEGLFTTVLKTSVADGQYVFLTQNSGADTVKSPLGMFDTYAIDNDLKYVDTKIRNYYEIGEFADDAAVKALDDVVSRADIEKPDSDGRKRRRKSRNDENEKEKHEKASIEEKARETGAAVGTDESADAKPTERKRKRRKRDTVAEETAELVNGVSDVDDSDIPF